MNQDTAICCVAPSLLKPLPFVKRLIFISTPQRGSYVAGWGLVKRFTDLLVKPATILLSLSSDIFSAGQERIAVDLQGQVPSSVDNMKPK